MDQGILKLSQKNEILKLIDNSKFLPSKFRWSFVDSKHKKDLQVSRIDYDNSPFFYQFDYDDGGHCGIYSPGKDRLIDIVHPGSWGTQKFYFYEWLTQLRIEIEQPDLWSEIAKHQLPADPRLTSDISNDIFDKREIETILSGLNKVRTYIEEMGLATGKQYKFADQKLQYLAEGTERLGRKDWIHTCIGVMATIIVGLALTPQQSQALWNFIKNALISVLRLLPG